MNTTMRHHSIALSLSLLALNLFSLPSSLGAHRATTATAAGVTLARQFTYPSSLRFEANRGQTAALVRFLAHGAGFTLFLTPREAVWSFAARSAQSTPSRPAPDVVRLRFVGANARSRVVGLDRLRTLSNYLLGNNPNAWHTAIPTFSRVMYRDLYPGIRLLYQGSNGAFGYDFAIMPRANPRAIRLALWGVQRPRLDLRGRLHLSTEGAIFSQEKPRAYQMVRGIRRIISASYLLSRGRQFGVSVGAYDKSRPLYIDVGVSVALSARGNDGATSQGTDVGDDEGRGIAIDTAGNAYITGWTDSTTFPTTGGAIQSSNAGNYDVFVAKLSADGHTLLYSTYLGGSGADGAYRIAVDGAGDAVVTGSTFSTDFPITNAAQRTFGGGICQLNGVSASCPDAFVAKLNPTGSALLYSTYLGGSGPDLGNGIAVDAGGNAYITGYTASANFPISNAMQPLYRRGSAACTYFGFVGPCPDAFMTKISATGTLLYSTYLGGTSGNYGIAIAVDNTGDAYITGYTTSANFPIAHALESTFHGAGTSCTHFGLTGPCPDAFVTEINSADTALVFSTYLGGTDGDYGLGIAVDNADAIHLSGSTFSSDFPTVNALQPTAGGLEDGYVAKLSPGGAALAFSTHLGGSGTDGAKNIAVDSAGDSFVTGASDSPNFPTANPLQGAIGGGSCTVYGVVGPCFDIIVAKLSPTGTALQYSTFLGGSGNEEAWSIAVDGNGDVYLGGWSNSSNFPTANALQPTFSGGGTCVILANPGPCPDAVVSKLNPSGSALVYSTYLGSSY